MKNAQGSYPQHRSPLLIFQLRRIPDQHIGRWGSLPIKGKERALNHSVHTNKLKMGSSGSVEIGFMQEERTVGPHSYLAAYVILALAVVLGIVGLLFMVFRTFWGDQPLEKCEFRVQRLARRLHQDYVSRDGSLPSTLEHIKDPELTRCPYCRDESMKSANYLYRPLDKETFLLECRYEAHRMMSIPFPKARYRASLTEDLQVLSTKSDTANR